MLSSKQKQALDLLFRMSPEAVERRLKLRRGRIYAWLNYVPFQRALEARRRYAAESAVRIGTRSLLGASRRMASAMKNGDDKTAIAAAQAVLKMSGLLTNACDPEEQSDETLADVINRCRMRAEQGESGTHR